MENKKRYTYYFRLRPPSIGTQPKGFVELNSEEQEVGDRVYWGYVVYEDELTDKEVYNYDLDKEPIKKSEEELRSLYYDFLVEVLDNDLKRIEEFIDDEETYNEFLNELSI